MVASLLFRGLTRHSSPLGVLAAGGGLSLDRLAAGPLQPGIGRHQPDPGYTHRLYQRLLYPHLLGRRSRKGWGLSFSLSYFWKGTLVGLFLANDLLLFYLFWEIQIIPMFFLVGIWGHQNRLHASIKFLLYTLAAAC